VSHLAERKCSHGSVQYVRDWPSGPIVRNGHLIDWAKRGREGGEGRRGRGVKEERQACLCACLPENSSIIVHKEGLCMLISL